MTTSGADHNPLSREIRVFLSSTFRDMDAERTHLIKQVFPKVRAACMARQVGFTEIDLRWGVTEEEAKNGATVEICLREIDRCRDFPPFFIGFLGERYGWIPQHDDLVAYWDKHVDTHYERTIRHAVERNISVTELEMELAVLARGAADKLRGQALFLLRDPKLTDTLYREDTGDAPNRSDPRYYDAGDGKLAALKEQIRATPFLGIDGYTSVKEFGQAIEDYLLAQLDCLFPENAVPTPLSRQRTAHATFRFHRLQNFLPRLDVRRQLLAAIERHIAELHRGPILLAGPSGQGKSALMADLAQHLETERPNWLVLDHYTGADDANHLESWARRILDTLYLRIAHLVKGIPDTPKEQQEALPSWISMACRKSEQEAQLLAGSTKLILILDAIDQNSDGGKQLDLLKPEVLGPDAVVVTSAADGTPAREAATDFETILVPPLTKELKAQMVTDTLGRFKKKLPVALARRLAGAKQSGNPLFLGLALEELRLDARHETLKSLIDDILKMDNAQELFLKHFLLDEDYGRPELPTLAAAFMALLAASRNGFSEHELADMLALPNDPVATDTGKPRLQQIHLSRLLANLEPFLLHKQGNRAPMHRLLGQAALDYFDPQPVHRHIFNYLQSIFLQPDTPKIEAVFRGKHLDSLLFHAIRTVDASLPVALVRDTNFVAVMVDMGDQVLYSHDTNTIRTLYADAQMALEDGGDTTLYVSLVNRLSEKAWALVFDRDSQENPGRGTRLLGSVTKMMTNMYQSGTGVGELDSARFTEMAQRIVNYANSGQSWDDNHTGRYILGNYLSELRKAMGIFGGVLQSVSKFPSSGAR